MAITADTGVTITGKLSSAVQCGAWNVLSGTARALQNRWPSLADFGVATDVCLCSVFSAPASLDRVR